MKVSIFIEVCSIPIDGEYYCSIFIEVRITWRYLEGIENLKHNSLTAEKIENVML